MKAVLQITVLFMLLTSCMHGGHKPASCGCDKGKPCAMDSKCADGAECAGCKDKK